MRASTHATRRGNGSTKEQILKKAGELFLERGFRGTSLEAIAGEVGITAAAIYWHFDSKVDVLFRFLESTFAEVLDRVDLSTAQTSTERLRQLATTHTRAQLVMVAEVGGRQVNFTGRQLLEGLTPRLRARLERAQDNYVHVCAGVLRAGAESGEFVCAHPVPTAFAIVNMCEDVNLWYRMDGPLSIDELTELYGELAVRMVSAATSPAADKEPPTSDRKRRAPAQTKEES